MNMRLLPMSIAIAMGLGVGFSKDVQAQRAVYCTNCATSSQAMGITAAIEGSRAAIVQAIQGASTAQTTATSETGRAISEANTATQAEMERLRISSRYALPDPCTMTSASRGGVSSTRSRPGGSGRGAGGGGDSGSASGSAGANTSMAKALEISSGSQPAPAPEIVAGMAASGACGTFASGGERARMCAGARFSTGVFSGFPNADVRAETLFDGPQTQSDMTEGVRRRLTIPPGNSPERTAVAAFIRNLETPLDLRALRPKELDSTSGRNYMASRDAYEAAMSLATKPMRDQQSLMTASASTLPVLQQMLKGLDASFVSTWLSQTYSNWRSDGISAAELLQLEAARRYMNEDWYARIVAADDHLLQIEALQLQALQVWQQNLLLERIQQGNVIAGAAAGAAIRKEKLPELVNLHKAAQLP